MLIVPANRIRTLFAPLAAGLLLAGSPPALAATEVQMATSTVTGPVTGVATIADASLVPCPAVIRQISDNAVVAAMLPTRFVDVPPGFGQPGMGRAAGCGTGLLRRAGSTPTA